MGNFALNAALGVTSLLPLEGDGLSNFVGSGFVLTASGFKFTVNGAGGALEAGIEAGLFVQIGLSDSPLHSYHSTADKVPEIPTIKSARRIDSPAAANTQIAIKGIIASLFFGGKNKKQAREKYTRIFLCFKIIFISNKNETGDNSRPIC